MKKLSTEIVLLKMSVWASAKYSTGFFREYAAFLELVHGETKRVLREEASSPILQAGEADSPEAAVGAAKAWVLSTLLAPLYGPVAERHWEGEWSRKGREVPKPLATLEGFAYSCAVEAYLERFPDEKVEKRLKRERAGWTEPFKDGHRTVLDIDAFLDL